jgi:hypothetical protein
MNDYEKVGHPYYLMKISYLLDEYGEDDYKKSEVFKNVKIKDLNFDVLYLLERMAYDIWQLQDKYKNLSNSVNTIKARLRRRPNENIYGRRK